MFYTEEDIQPVVDVVTEVFGPAGVMIEGKGVSKNVVLGSPAFGKVWYGDVDGDQQYIQQLLSIVEQRTQHQVRPVSENW